MFDLNGNAIPIGKDFTCPAGIELLGLIPESADMPHFEVIAEEEIPAVGDRILIVAVDGKSKGLSGIGGNIRGIGPDNMEIDANLTAEMSGAPVLSLRDGKVIGIVAHQLSGIANDWALGTRHEAGRNFVLRLDHMKEWQSGDLARFAKEEAYVRRITARTRVASAAQLMLECEVWLAVNRRPPYLSASRPAPGEDQTEFFKRRREESDSLAGRVKDWQLQRQRMQTLNKEALEQAAELESDPLIRKAQAWIKELGAAGKLEPGGDLDQKLTGIYRHILVDLKKKEPDLSAHLNQYHKEQYRLAVEDREEGIHTIEARINRVSR